MNLDDVEILASLQSKAIRCRGDSNAFLLTWLPAQCDHSEVMEWATSQKWLNLTGDVDWTFGSGNDGLKTISDEIAHRPLLVSSRCRKLFLI